MEFFDFDRLSSRILCSHSCWYSIVRVDLSFHEDDRRLTTTFAAVNEYLFLEPNRESISENWYAYWKFIHLKWMKIHSWNVKWNKSPLVSVSNSRYLTESLYFNYIQRSFVGVFISLQWNLSKMTNFNNGCIEIIFIFMQWAREAFMKSRWYQLWFSKYDLYTLLIPSIGKLRSCK